MGKITNINEYIKDTYTVQYGICGCGCDSFLLRVDHKEEDDYPEVTALECSGCREVVEFDLI